MSLHSTRRGDAFLEITNGAEGWIPEGSRLVALQVAVAWRKTRTGHQGPACPDDVRRPHAVIRYDLVGSGSEFPLQERRMS